MNSNLACGADLNLGYYDKACRQLVDMGLPQTNPEMRLMMFIGVCILIIIFLNWLRKKNKKKFNLFFKEKLRINMKINYKPKKKLVLEKKKMNNKKKISWIDKDGHLGKEVYSGLQFDAFPKQQKAQLDKKSFIEGFVYGTIATLNELNKKECEQKQ